MYDAEASEQRIYVIGALDTIGTDLYYTRIHCIDIHVYIALTYHQPDYCPGEAKKALCGDMEAHTALMSVGIWRLTLHSCPSMA